MWTPDMNTNETTPTFDMDESRIMAVGGEGINPNILLPLHFWGKVM